MIYKYNESLKGIHQSYNQSVYVIVRGVLDMDLVDEARRHVDWLMDTNPGTRPEQLHHTLVTNDPFWVLLISDPWLLDVAEQFIGPDIALFASHYICKPPRDGQAVLWHQDGSYWPLDPMEVIRLRVALAPSIGANDCMRVIPGTQTLDLQKLQERHDIPKVLESSMDDPLVDENQAINVILEPGEVSIHHPYIIHGSNANLSDMWRRGLTIRYISSHTSVTEPDWPCVMMLRGKPRPGINTYVPFPHYNPEKHISFQGCGDWSGD